MGNRTDIDWATIEAEYTTGQLSNRALAAKHGISEGAIRLRVKKLGLTKNNKAATQKRTKSKIRKINIRKASKMRSAHLSEQAPVQNPPTTIELIEAELVRAEQAVDDAVNTNIQVIEVHRLDIKRVRTLLEMMMAELALYTVNQEELEEIAHEQATSEDENGKKSTDYQKLNRFMKALSLNDRSGTLRNLAMVLERVIAKERQAFGIVDEIEPDDGSPDVILIGDYRPDEEEEREDD